MPMVGNGSRRSEVVRWALLSRALVWAVSFVASQLVTSYDTSTSIVYPGEDPSVVGAQTLTDAVVWRCFGQFARWDAAYFLRIAEVGYEYEKVHAFGPGLPALIAAVRRVTGLAWLDTPSTLGGKDVVLHVRSSLLLAGTLVSLVAFVGAAVAMYELSRVVLKNEKQSYLAAVLFCFNPASIFMSAVYTESAFACFSFFGMLCFELGIETSLKKITSCRGVSFEFLGVSLFFAATAVRSNGIVLAGFIVYFFFKRYLWFICASNILRVPNHPAVNATWELQRSLLGFLKHATFLWMSTAPYFLVLEYARSLYCNGHADTAVTSPDRPWCANSNIYAFVQKEYWSLGPFAYYEVKQIPNFLLACPAIGLSFGAAASYVKRVHHRPECHGKYPLIDRMTAFMGLNNREDSLDLPLVGYHSHRVAVYVWYMMALTLFGMVVMHIQVVTRFLCASSPPLYWFVASRIQKKKTFQTNAILLYFSVFVVMGSIVFSTFYPWT